MKNIPLERIRTQVAKKGRNLLVLGIVVIAFFATPFISLAHNTGSGKNIATEKRSRLGLLGDNGCLSQQNISRQDIANCLGLPDFSDLTSLCGNDVTDVPAGANQQDGGDCLGIPDLSNLTSLCKFLGIGNNNPNGIAAGAKQQEDIANCLSIPDLSDLTSLCKFLGGGNNNPNSIAAGAKQKDIANCLGIPDLSNLLSLGQGNNPNNISARVRASSKQSSPPIAKLAGILQFTTVQAGGRQTTSQTFIAQQDGGTLKSSILPAQVASIRKGDFIGAYFNGKLESGVGLGAGRADLYDPVTNQLTMVQLS